MDTLLKTAAAGLALAATSAVMAAPSSKFSAATADHVLIAPTEGTDGWVDVMSTGLKVPNQKDMFIQMAMECGVFTRTTVSDSAFGETADTDTADRAAAEAVVMARVRVENLKSGAVQYAHPEDVVLCARSQQLTALFNGICYDGSDGSEPDGNVQYAECDNNEELDLAVKTLNASAFNFILADLNAGDHVLTLEAKIDTRTQTCTVDDSLTSLLTQGDCAEDENGELIDGQGDAAAMGMVGNGSLAVEEVRMVQGETGVVEDEDGDGDTDYWGAFMDFIQ